MNVAPALITLDKNRSNFDWSKIMEGRQKTARQALPWVRIDNLVQLNKCVMLGTRIADKFPAESVGYFKYSNGFGKCDLTGEFGLCRIFLKELPK